MEGKNNIAIKKEKTQERRKASTGRRGDTKKRLKNTRKNGAGEAQKRRKKDIKKAHKKKSRE